jgi:hypothetical protein
VRPALPGCYVLRLLAPAPEGEATQAGADEKQGAGLGDGLDGAFDAKAGRAAAVQDLEAEDVQAFLEAARDLRRR